MARPLQELREAKPAEIVERRDHQITRLVAGSLAAAISVLVIASLVVGRSTQLDSTGTAVGGGFDSGTISLVDDDQGRLLFDLDDMGPGRPVSHCIEVTYDGTILPVELAMRAEAAGELARYLDVVVEQGTGGGFADCSGYRNERQVFQGTLLDLVEAGWVPVDRLLNSGESRSYRVVFEMQDDPDALDQSASTSFVWEVIPS